MKQAKGISGVLFSKCQLVSVVIQDKFAFHMDILKILFFSMSTEMVFSSILSILTLRIYSLSVFK